MHTPVMLAINILTISYVMVSVTQSATNVGTHQWTCDASPIHCVGDDTICDARDGDCSVQCEQNLANPTGNTCSTYDAGCCDATIHCPANLACVITCGFNCNRLRVYANSSTYLQISGCDDGRCDDMTIFCPKRLGSTCNIFQQSSSDMRNLNVYTFNAFASVFINGQTSNSNIHCYYPPGNRCEIDTADDHKLLCSNAGSIQCISPQPTPSPTNRPTASPTNPPTISSQTPSSQPTNSPTLSTQNPSNRPTKSPTNIPTTRSISPTQTPTQKPTQTPSKYPTYSPSHTPTKSPSNNPTASPNNNPTSSPTNNPTPTPTTSPTTAIPTTAAPTKSPSTFKPTIVFPTNAPTPEPTVSTDHPSPAPSRNPTPSPTNMPTTSPTLRPTATNSPSRNPSETPSANPTTFTPTTANPTNPPPTTSPTKVPTDNPSAVPSTSPTPAPVTTTASPDPTTANPTEAPTMEPTVPTMAPTQSPSSFRPTREIEPTASPRMSTEAAVQIADNTKGSAVEIHEEDSEVVMIVIVTAAIITDILACICCFVLVKRCCRKFKKYKANIRRGTLTTISSNLGLEDTDGEATGTKTSYSHDTNEEEGTKNTENVAMFTERRYNDDDEDDDDVNFNDVNFNDEDDVTLGRQKNITVEMIDIDRVFSQSYDSNEEVNEDNVPQNDVIIAPNNIILPIDPYKTRLIDIINES